MGVDAFQVQAFGSAVDKGHDSHGVGWGHNSHGIDRSHAFHEVDQHAWES